MNLSNTRFVTNNIDNLSFGYIIGEASKEEILNNSNIIQPFDNFNYLLSETQKRNSEVVFQLGMCFEFGSFFYSTGNNNQIISILQSFETAFSLFELAADLDSPSSNHHLGMIYEYGKGVKVDRVIAKRYFKKSADLGNGDSNYILGVFELKDNNISEGYDYFLKAADLGNSNAQYNVAIALYEGNLVWQKNLAMSFGYAKAAHDANPNDIEIKSFMNKVYAELMNEI